MAEITDLTDLESLSKMYSNTTLEQQSAENLAKNLSDLKTKTNFKLNQLLDSNLHNVGSRDQKIIQKLKNQEPLTENEKNYLKSKGVIKPKVSIVPKVSEVPKVPKVSEVPNVSDIKKVIETSDNQEIKNIEQTISQNPKAEEILENTESNVMKNALIAAGVVGVGLAALLGYKYGGFEPSDADNIWYNNLAKDF